MLVLQERDNEGVLMANVLRDQGMEVDLAFPAAVTPRVETLEDYDSIVLVDVGVGYELHAGPAAHVAGVCPAVRARAGGDWRPDRVWQGRLRRQRI